LWREDQAIQFTFVFNSLNVDVFNGETGSRKPDGRPEPGEPPHWGIKETIMNKCNLTYEKEITAPDINMPNFANAMATTAKVVDSISSLEDNIITHYLP
jgi:hypothetical protein